MEVIVILHYDSNKYQKKYLVKINIIHVNIIHVNIIHGKYKIKCYNIFILTYIVCQIK